MNPGIRAATPADAAALAEIYNHYIDHTIVTFEETRIDGAEMARRMNGVISGGLPWIVAELDGRVVGWAYATRWRDRSAYRYTVESTVYLAADATGHGIGSALYGRLIPQLRAMGFHTIVGVIALPNDGSVALHEKFGMHKVGHLEQVGFKFGQWVDVGYWQVTFPPAER